MTKLGTPIGGKLGTPINSELRREFRHHQYRVWCSSFSHKIYWDLFPKWYLGIYTQL